MPITNENPLSKKSTSLAELLERIRVTLSTPHPEWTEILGITQEDYRAFQNGQKDLSIVSLARLADHFEVSLENIMNHRIDFQTLAARNNGELASLPERYRIGARSKRRSSLNLVAATEEFLGWRARAMALRYLQVNEAAFADLDDVINLNFNTDLCAYLRKNFGNSHLFYQMGAYSIINNLQSPVGKALGESRTIPELYQNFIEQIVAQHWEQNFHYRILKITPTSLRAEGVPNPEVVDSLRVKNPGSEEVCQTKVGIASSIPGYLGLPFAHVEEVSCVHRGDASCVYEMTYEHAATLLKRNAS